MLPWPTFGYCTRLLPPSASADFPGGLTPRGRDTVATMNAADIVILILTVPYLPIVWWTRSLVLKAPRPWCAHFGRMVLVGCGFLGTAWVLQLAFDPRPTPTWIFLFGFCFVAWNDSPPSLRRQERRALAVG